MNTKCWLLVAAIGLGGVATATQAADDAAGKAAYEANCSACHQMDGTGIPFAFPPLAGSDYLEAHTPENIAHQILTGLSGPVTVNGTEFNGVMPPMAHINDADIALIVNYVFGRFIDREASLDEAAVAAVRAGLAAPASSN